jgi:hypothetical protein
VKRPTSDVPRPTVEIREDGIGCAVELVWLVIAVAVLVWLVISI